MNKKQDAGRGFTRRGFGKLCLGVSALAALLAGCTSGVRSRLLPTCDKDEGGESEYDYIVVGSGAGGGPLAANLARKGHRVLLVEAGGDDEPHEYRIPLFHPLASEDPRLRWDFFVRHFGDDRKSRRDSKFSADQDGVLYPRSSTLGGCTAHNAMILIYPHDRDWNQIAAATGDPTWSSEAMRAYFERLEDCQYQAPLPGNPHRRGFSGWLPTSMPGRDLLLGVFRDRQLRDAFAGSVLAALHQRVGDPLEYLFDLKNRLDPNNWRSGATQREGLCAVPLTTRNGARAGSREYVRAVEKVCDGRLKLMLNTLATRVLLEDVADPSGGTVRKKAVGIEFRRGRRLYRADRVPAAASAGEAGTLRARHEVILAGGAFNTPQLLMLSGIGPEGHLRDMGIPVRIPLEGVGKNLQDRYEVALVSEMKDDFSILHGMSYRIPGPGEPPNPFYEQWLDGRGLFTTNGAVISLIKKSTPDKPEPDLFIFGMPGYFSGYFPGYSQRVTADQRHFTWAILKAHTRNTAGVVRLRSSDPCERPEINFHYFEEGNDTSGEDLSALVDGIRFVRKITEGPGMREHILREAVPGPEVRSPTELADFARYNAWGHHASCSCRMGAADDPLAVVDSRFRVRGCDGLRIVDASVFPRIPGFFIVSAVYMISEKASDVIHEDSLKIEA